MNYVFMQAYAFCKDEVSGLSIVKKIDDVHHGKVWGEPGPGAGRNLTEACELCRDS